MFLVLRVHRTVPRAKVILAGSYRDNSRVAGGAVFCRVTCFLVSRIESDEDGESSIVSSCALTKSLRAASALKPFASRIVRNKDKVKTHELVRITYRFSNVSFQKMGKILIEVKLQSCSIERIKKVTEISADRFFNDCLTVCASPVTRMKRFASLNLRKDRKEKIARIISLSTRGAPSVLKRERKTRNGCSRL